LYRDDWFPDEIYWQSIARRLESEAKVPLVDSDVRLLADSVASWRQKRLKAPQRVHLAMKAIGKPAHYSAIAEMHNIMFPERTTSVRNIQGTLGRGEYGIVWIGVRGTYALEEWGYERPEATLFETVAQIVSERHQATGRPVPLTVIRAELGKRRAMVKPASFAIATYCNDDLRRVHGDCFVPRGVAADEEELLDDRLDRVLREFREQSTSAGSEGLDS